MESIWQTSVRLPQYPQLRGEISTDTLIIGGGMAGLLCAYQLKKAGVDCIVAERKNIAGGVTQNTTAKLTSQHGLIYRKLAKQSGLEATVSLLTPSRKRCPHLGCALKWNAREHSWDCPCHGSRFSADGHLLDNPATGDLPKK